MYSVPVAAVGGDHELPVAVAAAAVADGSGSVPLAAAVLVAAVCWVIPTKKVAQTIVLLLFVVDVEKQRC